MDFYPITKTNEKIVIEWSFKKGKNLRAKHKEDKEWKYGKTEKAKYAYTAGLNLMRGGN